MEEKGINVLIVGHGACASSLAKKLKSDAKVGHIFITGKDLLNDGNFEYTDIREDNATELLKFALENNIDITIPISELAIKSDITSFFNENEQKIFSPTRKAAQIVTNKVFGKKFLYKIKVQTAKFGVFDKTTSASEFLDNSNFPLIIQSGSSQINDSDKRLFTTIKPASEFLYNLINFKGEKDVLLEEYIFGHHFNAYYITDGYSALPLNIAGTYKFSQDEDSGFYKEGMGSYVPDYKIDLETLSCINEIADNVIKTLENSGTPYTGILGLDCVLGRDGKLYVNEFRSFMNDCDCPAILTLLDESFIELCNSCIQGFFSDEYEQIKNNEYYTVSAKLLSSKNTVIEELEEFDDIEDIDSINLEKIQNKYFTTSGQAFIITKKGATLKRARDFLYEDLSHINNKNLQYRKDIALSKKY